MHIVKENLKKSLYFFIVFYTRRLYICIPETARLYDIGISGLKEIESRPVRVLPVTPPDRYEAPEFRVKYDDPGVRVEPELELLDLW